MQDAVDRPEERGPSLIVEDYDDAGVRQRGTAAKLPLHTPGQGEPPRKTETDKEACKNERYI